MCVARLCHVVLVPKREKNNATRHHRHHDLLVLQRTIKTESRLRRSVVVASSGQKSLVGGIGAGTLGLTRSHKIRSKRLTEQCAEKLRPQNNDNPSFSTAARARTRFFSWGLYFIWFHARKEQILLSPHLPSYCCSEWLRQAAAAARGKLSSRFHKGISGRPGPPLI